MSVAAISESINGRGRAELTLVVALGGNALLRKGDDGTIETQFKRSEEAMSHLVPLIAAGHHVVLTHGNGPIVGNILLRSEAARDQVPPMPLYIADADSEGGIGLMLQQALKNGLRRAGIERNVATIITQVVVAADDPAFERPSKPIGPIYSAEEAARLAAERGWTVAEELGCGWRRIVASPRPQRVIETPSIEALVKAGHVVIAAGGGGVPVVEDADGRLAGIDAVVDKDWASAVLAREIGADVLVILMEADAVYLGWGTPDARRLERITADEAERLLASGMFAEGSVGPKVAAAAQFARQTGREALICASEQFESALAGASGTRVTP